MFASWWTRWRGGWALNVALRILVVAFAAEAALAGDDPRFDGKGIAVRNLVFAATTLTLAFPLVHAVRRRPLGTYPLRADCLFLSILVVDMAANSLDLYEQAWRFDLIPHAYGPLAGFLALHALGVAVIPSVLIVNGLHVALEVQEALGDVVFGTHNVHGAWDTLTDLAAGVIGSVVVPLAWWRIRHVRPTSGRSAAIRAYSGPWQIARPRQPSSSTPRPSRPPSPDPSGAR